MTAVVGALLVLAGVACLLLARQLHEVTASARATRDAIKATWRADRVALGRARDERDAARAMLDRTRQERDELMAAWRAQHVQAGRALREQGEVITALADELMERGGPVALAAAAQRVGAARAN